MPSAAEILIRIVGESAGLDRELKKSSGDVKKFTADVEKSGQRIGAFGNIVQGVFQGIGQAIFASLVTGVRAAVGQIDKSIKLASDLGESINKVNVAFGESGQEILDWSQNSAKALGQSRGQALEAASSFGLLFSTMGVGQKQSVEMSKGLVQLAADMASINNITPEEALEKLRAGLVGEVEPLRTVGVLLNAAAVEAKALELGLAPSTKAITEQDKVMARYALILEQTALTQGDFARTSDGLANSQRTLAGQLDDLSAKFGNFLLPIKTAFITGLSDLITIIEPYGENIMRSLIGGIADGIVFLLPVLGELRRVFVTLLKPGSPPKLLPELTEWGKGALKAYLEGWSDPDISALRTLGTNIEDVLRSFAATGRLKETDLVSRVFGSQRAIVDAINEWRAMGSVTVGTLDNIRRAAGPAGDSVTGLVQSYFNLQAATDKASEAQERLDAITRKYNDALDPLNDKLDANARAQQKIRDAQDLERLGGIIGDKTVDLEERQLARLEQEEILLRQQADAIENERDTVVDAEQAKVDAYEAERKAKEDSYNLQQAILAQQVEANQLLAEDIALRKKLAEEAMAQQEKAARELEAQRAKEAAELERNTSAHLRYRLAIADDAGQLAILQEELAKTTEGSAEYWSILTDIANVQERIAKLDDGDGDDKTEKKIEDITEAAEKWPEVIKMEEALAKFFATLAGQDNQPDTLTWGEGIVKSIRDIGGAAQDAWLIIGDFINFFNGESGDSGSTSDRLRPTYNSGIFGQIYSVVTTVLTALRQIFTGDWQPLWDGFKQYVFDSLSAHPESPFWQYLQDTVIPAIEALAVGDWKTAWELMSNPIKAVADNAYIQGYNTVYNWWEGFKAGAADFITPDWWEKFFGDMMGDLGFPSNPFDRPESTKPQSYSIPGVTPSTIIPASIAGVGGSTTTNNNTPVTVNLSFVGPVTPETVRTAARTTDDVLRSLGYSTT